MQLDYMGVALLIIVTMGTLIFFGMVLPHRLAVIYKKLTVSPVLLPCIPFSHEITMISPLVDNLTIVMQQDPFPFWRDLNLVVTAVFLLSIVAVFTVPALNKPSFKTGTGSFFDLTNPGIRYGKHIYLDN